MKTILILLTLCIFTACSEPERPYSKTDVCEEILRQRHAMLTDYYVKDKEQISRLDSFFFKCGCDTIK